MDADKKDQFVGILILDYINKGGKLATLSTDKGLEALLVKMLAKGYLKVEGRYYAQTPAGIAILKVFMQRYSEYIRLYDVFSFVDLTAGEFAFKKFFALEPKDWKEYIKTDNWEDCRVAVAEFKKLDPIEQVFMSFINEGRFDLSKPGWQLEVWSGLIWEQILEICNKALSVEQINQGNEAVMPDIITQGTKLAVDLIKEEEAIIAEEDAAAKKQAEEEGATAEEETVVEETVEEVVEYHDYFYPYTYYEPYYDPFYVGLIWSAPLFLW